MVNVCSAHHLILKMKDQIYCQNSQAHQEAWLDDRLKLESYSECTWGVLSFLVATNRIQILIDETLTNSFSAYLSKKSFLFNKKIYSDQLNLWRPLLLTLAEQACILIQMFTTLSLTNFSPVTSQQVIILLI